jgi:hypothetical protein
LGEDTADIISESGAVNSEKLAALKKSDPIKFAIAVRQAQRLEEMVGEAHKLFNGLVGFDEKNVLHAELGNFAIYKERELLSRPTTERKDAQGRAFAAKEDYDKMSAADRAKHWTFSESDLAAMLCHDFSASTPRMIEEEDKRFKAIAIARGLITEAPEKPAKPAEKDDTDADADDGDKPRSPTIPGEARAPKGKSISESSGKDAFIKAFIG